MADNAERRITMSDRLERTAPYNLFFNVVEKSPETAEQVNAIMFKDLFCPSLGLCKRALLTTYSLDTYWLRSQCEENTSMPTDLTILCKDEPLNFPNLRVMKVPLDVYSKHHSKLGIFVYENSLRVMVSTANLTKADWLECNQGLWLSPNLPMNNECEYERPIKKVKRENGEAADPRRDSPTGFKSDFIKYLNQYDQSLNLESWIQYVQQADFSKVRVGFIYSVPGYHEQNSNGSHLGGMENILSEHCNIPLPGASLWNIVAQVSSISDMGTSSSQWLEGQFRESMMTSQNASENKPNVKVIFPSKRNVQENFNGTSCFFSNNWQVTMGTWLRNHLCHWKADGKHRTNIMPHIKTYCKVSPKFDKIEYFLLTSANLSQGAWGKPVLSRESNEMKTKYNIRNYEAGVLFLPKFFWPEYFTITQTEEEFPFMYDFPLVPYTENDMPADRQN